MTFNEFLVKLKAAKRKWKKDKWGKIRSRSVSRRFHHCPISAVTGDIGDFCAPRLAGKALGLRESLVIRIQQAADGEMPRSITYRRLLEACGL